MAYYGVDTEVRFRSATERAAFTSELTDAITKLVAKYHDESAPGGRRHRLVVVAHPYRSSLMQLPILCGRGPKTPAVGELQKCFDQTELHQACGRQLSF